MTIFPAIDMKGGRCVRLRQGVASDETVYGDDPVAMAKRWQSDGAKALHLVDLDGAFQGRPVHADAVAKIAAALSIPVEIGGGIRTADDARTMLDAGAWRVIIGTRALAGDGFLEGLVREFGGERIVVGIDARDGLVQVKGWVETTGTSAADLAKRVGDIGVRTIIYTDTATDGMLSGPNLTALSRICDATTCDVVASGGVSSPDHVRALRALGKWNLVGAIVGKALYEGRTSVGELNAAGENA
ncbi:MAG: 1-(5-phosphoribosyl)-5-[Kiritimatiellae bacterium]|nr:1-(5-phosphoribosyl)-5-[(5-phosphoribosylamino)methylideneamino]imidazole-4-carboxamide isomerase [Kiritimatiellia bacterium]